MKLEFKKRLLEIDLYGEAITMSFPTVSQFKGYQKKLKEAGADGEVDTMLEFLCDLGLPKDKMDEMEPDHLKQVLEVLSGSKKK
jgi:hypothetical protein